MRKIPLLLLLGSSAAMAQVTGPLVTTPSFTGVSESLTVVASRGMTNAFQAEGFMQGHEHTMPKAVANRNALTEPVPSVTVAVPAAYNQTATFQPLGAPIGANFAALGLGTPGFIIAGAPPDTTMGVSPTQIVQWVNTQLAVYDKAGNAQLAAPGFVNGNAIWAGLPAASICRTTNRGDPLVQYDRIADRWVLSQFAFNSNFSANSQCIAVSQTSNAAGAYNLYEYSFGNVLPDYGKLGIWPDAYYITYNLFSNGASYAGGSSCAYDRTAMIAGAASPQQICFNSTSRWSFLPSDLDGTLLPPAGSPNYQISWNWVFTTNAPYTMQLTKFHVDFVTPANSTFNDGFGGALFSNVAFTLDAATLAACNDGGGTCAPQVGTTQKLDTLNDRHMYRLVYRNFATYDALLFTQSTDASATASTANLRWWEIRNPAANPPQVYQNSTFNINAANTESRWMSSAAFDKLGNIGIGYSVSSSAINPGIRVTGRRRTDPKNVLRTEVVAQAGSGSQIGLSRWGDYSTMQVDPADDCTLWYTTQYIGTNGSFNWNTRIASFKFPNCL